MKRITILFGLIIPVSFFATSTCIINSAFDNAPEQSGHCENSSASLDDRSSLSESSRPNASWYDSEMFADSWGPLAAHHPAVSAPVSCDALQWKRSRILNTAKKYIGLDYQHHHVPGWNPKSIWSTREGAGLDCSNFTSWVYNLGLGIKFTSEIESQAEGVAAPGRKLGPAEQLEAGDLIYVYNEDRATIGHVVIFITTDKIIDSTDGGVQIRSFQGWYKDRYAFARRILN